VSRETQIRVTYLRSLCELIHEISQKSLQSFVDRKIIFETLGHYQNGHTIFPPGEKINGLSFYSDKNTLKIESVRTPREKYDEGEENRKERLQAVSKPDRYLEDTGIGYFGDISAIVMAIIHRDASRGK